MKMKTTKFLAVMAILAFAFVAFAVDTPSETDAADSDITTTAVRGPIAQAGSATDLYTSYTVEQKGTDITVTLKDLAAHLNGQNKIGYWTGLGFNVEAPTGTTISKVAYYYSDKSFDVDDVTFTTQDSLDEWKDFAATTETTYKGFWILKPNTYPEMYIALKWIDSNDKEYATGVYHVTDKTTVKTGPKEVESGTTVIGNFPNGVTVTGNGQETFENFTGEIKIGGNVFQATNFSGTITAGAGTAPGTAIVNTITAGTLEFVSEKFADQTITNITGNLIIGSGVKEVKFTQNLTVTGSIQLKAGATATFAGTINLTGPEGVVGKLIVGPNAQMNAEKKITMTGDLTVRGTLVLGNAATNADSELLALTGNGSIYGVIKSFDVDDQPTTVKITVTAPASSTATVLFKAYDGSSIIYVDVEKTGDDSQKARTTIDLSGATSTVYLHGTISTSQTYGQIQNVVVDGDLEIKDGAVIEINGGFLINDDCKMTITSGKVIVAGAGVNVVIDGDIYVDVGGEFDVQDGVKSVKINGIVENGGTMAINTLDLTVAKDGKMIINDLAKSTSISNITVAAGGLLQIGGKIGQSTITNKGSVVFNEAVLKGDVTVKMYGDGAVVSILSAKTDKEATDNEAATAKKITITDDGLKGKSTLAQTYVNTITITTKADFEVGFSGIGVAQSVSTTTTAIVSKFILAGNFGVVGDGATAIMNMGKTETTTDKCNFAFADGFTIGPGTTVNVNYLTSVDYNMFVVGAAGTGNGATLTGKLTVNGVIEGNSYATITDTDPEFSAAKFTVGLGTDVEKYYSSIENAVEILEDYTEPISLTILGENLVVKESVTIPSNISLKGDGKFTIGTKTNNDVIMDVEKGSSIASGLSIKVLGTLYLENAKDLKTTKVTADVKTTDGTDLCYTNLYTALANAEFGDIIEVTTDKLDIIKSIVVPEGVVLNIPAGVTAEVEVKNKVTITVNGVLMTGGITGPFADEVSATAAVLVVNGIFMTSESTAATEADKIAAVNGTYKSSGVYYYISNDIGDFVYISSLADAVMSGAKNFTVYGKVIETEDITLTKGMSVTMGSGAELFAPSITLSDAKITILDLTTPGELTALIKGADGESSFAVTEFSVGIIEDKYDSTDKVNKLSFNNIGGTIAILSGTVFTGLSINAGNDSSLTVADGATLYIPTSSVVTLDEAALIIGDVYVAGTLYLDSEDVVITGDITVLYDATSALKGKLFVTENGVTFVSGVITVMDGAEFHLQTTITAGVEPTDLGAAATIFGDVTLEGNFAIIAYPGADMDGMTISGKAPVSTEFYINDELFMTAYSAAGKVKVSAVISVPDYKIPELEKGAAEKLKTLSTWGVSDNTYVGDYGELYADIALATVKITTSWVNGLALYIDGARAMTYEMPLTVGVYVITASVNAGYACDNITITFNGVALPVTKEGTILTIGLEDEGSVLAVSGDVYIPEPEPVTPEEKSEWTITTILLVILVILIAIMAVIVALRLNRS